MRTSRREFLQTSALASLATLRSTPSVASDGGTAGISTGEHLNASEIARRHMIVRDVPSASFFDGMLLGNGDVGACVVVRPDALAIHIGKNDCWDIRVSEDIAGQVLPFRELLQLWQRASEEAKRIGKPDMQYLESGIPLFREYSERVATSYDGKKCPRPWPCGTIWINWDPRWVEPGQHTLDLASGLFTLTLRCTNFENENSRVQLFVFVDWKPDSFLPRLTKPCHSAQLYIHQRLTAFMLDLSSQVSAKKLPHSCRLPKPLPESLLTLRSSPRSNTFLL